MEIGGPKDENLKKIFSMMSSMAQGINEGKIGGPKPLGSKACVGCCKIFGRAHRDGTLKPDVCKECRKTLVAGGTIFVCDDQRMVKILPKETGRIKVKPEYAGRIVKVPKLWMDQLHLAIPAEKSEG